MWTLQKISKYLSGTVIACWIAENFRRPFFMESLRLHAFIIFFKIIHKGIAGVLVVRYWAFWCFIIWLYSLFCQSQCITPAFITSRLGELEIRDLILILKSQISDSVTSCLILFLKNQRKLHVNENRANVYKHKQTVATGVHHYKYITLHSIWAEAQKLDIVRELGGRVHYLKERKQKSASIKFL